MMLETARLVLRPVAPRDHAVLHAMFVEPGVRRFVFDDEIIAPETVTEIICRSQELFRTERYGLWLATPRDAAAGVLVGFGAFWYFRDPPELELLYGISDAHVRNGYGREIARAVVDYGFRALGMTAIRASTDASHTASRRVLDDLGFTLDREAMAAGIQTAFYRASPQILDR